MAPRPVLHRPGRLPPLLPAPRPRPRAGSWLLRHPCACPSMRATFSRPRRPQRTRRQSGRRCGQRSPNQLFLTATGASPTRPQQPAVPWQLPPLPRTHPLCPVCDLGAPLPGAPHRPLPPLPAEAMNAATPSKQQIRRPHLLLLPLLLPTRHPRQRVPSSSLPSASTDSHRPLPSRPATSVSRASPLSPSTLRSVKDLPSPLPSPKHKPHPTPTPPPPSPVE